MDNALYQEVLYNIIVKDGKSVPKRFNEQYFKNLGMDHLLVWIESLYPKNLFDFGDSCKALLNGIFTQKNCDTCGNVVTSWAKKTNSFRRFCSDTCRNNDPNISSMKTSIWTPENKKSGSLARKKHYLEHYGVDHNMKIPEIAKKSGISIKETKSKQTESERITRETLYRQSRMPYTYHLVTDRDWLFDQYVTKENSVNLMSKKFGISGEAIKNAILRFNIPYTPEREYVKHISLEEQTYYDFIKTIRPDAIQSFNAGYELDVYIPELKIGFEYNGCYYHSETFRHKSYHKNKVNHFGKMGIRVVQIWSDSWLYNRTRTENFITNILCPSKPIGARKCTIHELDIDSYKSFLDEMHMQGASGASIRYGLFYEDKLVSVMGFKKLPHNTKNVGYELCRFANKNVVGGFSKLLSNFCRNFPGIDVYSFADIETVNLDCNVYTKNGFVQIDVLDVDYKYYNPRSKIREHKFGWRKSAFASLGYDIEGKTEAELSREARLVKCWDSGKILYKLGCK